MQTRFFVLKQVAILAAYRSKSDPNPLSLHVVNDYIYRPVAGSRPVPSKANRLLGRVDSPSAGVGRHAALSRTQDLCSFSLNTCVCAAFVLEDQVNRLAPRFEVQASTKAEADAWAASFATLARICKKAYVIGCTCAIG